MKVRSQPGVVDQCSMAPASDIFLPLFVTWVVMHSTLLELLSRLSKPLECRKIIDLLLESRSKWANGSQSSFLHEMCILSRSISNSLFSAATNGDYHHVIAQRTTAWKFKDAAPAFYFSSFVSNAALGSMQIKTYVQHTNSYSPILSQLSWCIGTDHSHSYQLICRSLDGGRKMQPPRPGPSRCEATMAPTFYLHSCFIKSIHWVVFKILDVLGSKRIHGHRRNGRKCRISYPSPTNSYEKCTKAKQDFFFLQS